MTIEHDIMKAIVGISQSEVVDLLTNIENRNFLHVVYRTGYGGDLSGQSFTLQTSRGSVLVLIAAVVCFPRAERPHCVVFSTFARGVQQKIDQTRKISVTIFVTSRIHRFNMMPSQEKVSVPNLSHWAVMFPCLILSVFLLYICFSWLFRRTIFYLLGRSLRSDSKFEFYFGVCWRRVG